MSYFSNKDWLARMQLASREFHANNKRRYIKKVKVSQKVEKTPEEKKQYAHEFYKRWYEKNKDRYNKERSERRKTKKPPTESKIINIDFNKIKKFASVRAASIAKEPKEIIRPKAEYSNTSPYGYKKAPVKGL